MEWWISVLHAMAILFVWAAGAYGSTKALSELLEDETMGLVGGVFWPVVWPLLGVFVYINRNDEG